MWKRVLLVFLLSVFIILTAHASAPSWLEVHSPHFRVISDANEKEARRIADQFERMRSVFHTIFPNTSLDDGAPIIVIAARDRKGFQMLEPEAYLAKGQLDLAGLFLNAPNQNYILLRLDASGEHPYATIYHEYTHFLWRRHAQWLPLWLNEGMAEFFQNSEIQDKQVMLGEPDADNILYLRQTRLFPLTTLLTVDQSSPYYHEENKGSIFYAESWALAHYLFVTDKQTGANRLSDYVQLVSQHIDSVTAAERAFGDLKQLQKKLDAYVLQTGFQQFKLSTATQVNDQEFTVQTLTLAQANAVRADFLAADGRVKDARALLDTVLRDDPGNAEAHATMGSLEARDGNLKSAQNWYQQAVKLGSQSYFANYYFAALSMELGELDASQNEQVEASLRKSIQLNPGFAPAYDRLAVLLSMQHRNLQEAHMLGLQAVTVDPDNLNYRINISVVLFEMERFQDVIDVLQSARSLAKTPAEKSALDERILMAEQRLQAMKSTPIVVVETTTAKNGTGTPQSGLNVPNREGSVSVRSTTVQTVVGGEVKTFQIEQVKHADEPRHPDEARGPKHLVEGVVRIARCSYPTILELEIESAGKTISLYNNNFLKVEFTTLDFSRSGTLDPCKDLNGVKARATYLETSDKTTDGQVIAMVLRK